jgi:SAM-dependent methyltransferase
MHPRYDIRFPRSETSHLSQAEAFFHLIENNSATRLRFHDYGEIYRRPGLYEQLFYERLRCSSPAKALEVLGSVLKSNRADIHELRVLDLGAGNGMVGELLHGARTVGVDIEQEARDACVRDRPGAYDAFYVTDLCASTHELLEELRAWQFNCLACVAALGFGDIPVPAFASAFNLIQPEGWIVFNIKETFLQERDNSGFSRLIKHMLMGDLLQVHHLERYRHRLSIDGAPLFYYMLCGRKMADIPAEITGRFAGGADMIGSVPVRR